LENKEILMKIHEELRDKENKKLWQQLVKKYHPDNKKTGDEKIMKKINNAYEKGDEAFKRFHDELTGKKPATDDWDKTEPEGFEPRDRGGEMNESPILRLIKKIKKEEYNFVLTISKRPSLNRAIIESYDMILKSKAYIRVDVSMIEGGRPGMVQVDIKLMDGQKPIEDKGPVPIANDEMLEKRIKQLIEKAKKMQKKEKKEAEAKYIRKS